MVRHARRALVVLLILAVGCSPTHRLNVQASAPLPPAPNLAQAWQEVQVQAFLKADYARRHTVRVVRAASVGRRVYGGTPGPHPCGPAYDLPPCYVMLRESGGNPNAYNPTGCGGRGCRGKWQCDPRTCSGTGTEAQQDAEARTLWDGGEGCSHWAACG